ncbi:type II toxin-antitoxin system RelB/DinJ family antitoxin [Granulicella tundricola]|uniref:Addiction module antitoxin, RelB/DinJ family n=1 Tax=Granulicella tundricola (strain ATCC BAA-1859 / DSM 23138 / MP5ACTX9) TaxID=1198114 RepID=E8X3Z5_GRATM|nr:type II toxin-antitoxin system RelB/DinJ family antitoxin [Granulicella tundricola]ADW70503.1 addiction module antitoxin, RelB/DinJ family [Granulicella tundricola MP5ACTX9]
MATTALVVTMDESLDREASAVLAGIGFTVDQAVKLLLTQVVKEKCLPPSLHVPNQDTIDAMQELKDGGGEQFANVEDMLASLGI